MDYFVLVMDNFYVLAVVLAAGYVLGWIGHSRAILNRLKENPEFLRNKIRESIDSNELSQSDNSEVREFEVEKIEGIFYLFAKDNGEFLGQAASLEEALEVATDRFPTQSFQGVISEEDARNMGII